MKYSLIIIIIQQFNIKQSNTKVSLKYPWEVENRVSMKCPWKNSPCMNLSFYCLCSRPKVITIGSTCVHTSNRDNIQYQYQKENTPGKRSAVNIFPVNSHVAMSQHSQDLVTMFSSYFNV